MMFDKEFLKKAHESLSKEPILQEEEQRPDVVEVEFNDIESIEINRHEDYFSVHLYDRWEALGVRGIHKDKIIELIEKLQDLIR
jgi:hypothetical protein